MQKNIKTDDKIADDDQQRRADELRKKYAGNGMAVGICAGMVGGIIFIAKYGLAALIVGALIGGLIGVRVGLEFFKRRRQ